MIFNNKTEFINLCADETGAFHRISDYETDLASDTENQQICLLFKNTVDELLNRAVWNFAITLPAYLDFEEELDMPIYKEKWSMDGDVIRVSNVRLNQEIVKDRELLCRFEKTGALIRGTSVYIQVSTAKYNDGGDGRLEHLLYADATEEPDVKLWPDYFTDLVKFSFTYKVTRKLYNSGTDDTKHFSELELRLRNAKLQDLQRSEVPPLAINWYCK